MEVLERSKPEYLFSHQGGKQVIARGVWRLVGSCRSCRGVRLDRRVFVMCVHVLYHALPYSCIMLLSARGPGTTVSYRPILPPKWAMLQSDERLYPIPRPIREDTGNMKYKLDHDSTCLCGNTRTFYDPSQPTVFRQCKLYTLATVFEVEIELQKCSTCPPKRRRYIGPDLRLHGIFNFNNSILATHELLDAYTSAYTTSETPFIGWVTQTSRIYANVDTVFMGPDLFRSVWFAFAFLQNLVDDMVCRICKSNPDTAIWDGLTLAFGKKHLRDSIRPPTVSHSESIIRRKVVYQPHQQILKNRDLRKSVREALAGPSVHAVMQTARQMEASMAQLSAPSTPTRSHQNSPSLAPMTPRTLFPPSASTTTPTIPIPPSTPSRPSTTPSAPITPFSPSKAALKHVSQVELHLKRIKECAQNLKSQCPALAAVFERYVGPEAYAAGRHCPALWRSFFKQVSNVPSI